MKRRLAKFRRLPWSDRFVLGEAWGRLVLIGAALRVLPAYRRRLGEGSRAEIGNEASPGGTPEVRISIIRLHRLVAIAAGHHVYAARCLERSLCLRSMLGARGISAELRIGVHRRGRELEAHAWVEVGGEPVGEPGGVDRHYAVLETAPPSG